MDHKDKKLLICIHGRFGNATSCDARGAADLVPRFEAELVTQGLAGRLETIDCFGLCSEGVNVRFAPGGAFIHHVAVDQVASVVAKFRDFCGPDCGPLEAAVEADPVAQAYAGLFAPPKDD